MSVQPVFAKKRLLSKSWSYVLVALAVAVSIAVVTWPAPSPDAPTASRSWQDLSAAQQKTLQRQAFLLFPESFTTGNTQHLIPWLATQDIVHPNAATFFNTAGVQDIIVNGEVYIDAPAPLVTLFNDIEGVMAEMATMESAVLQRQWGVDPSVDPDVRMGIWVYIVRESLPTEHFPLFLAIVLSAQ